MLVQLFVTIMDMSINKPSSQPSVRETIESAHKRAMDALATLKASFNQANIQHAAALLLAWIVWASSANAQTTKEVEALRRPSITLSWPNSSNVVWVGILAVPAAGEKSSTATIDLRPEGSPSRLREQGLTPILLTNGNTITFAELLEVEKKDPKKEEEILDMIPDNIKRKTQREYIRWKSAWLKQEVNQKKEIKSWIDKEVNQLDKSILEKRSIIASKDATLVAWYINYVTLAEKKQLTPKQSQLLEIINHPSTPTEVRERATKLQNSTI
jgi:hypothetical protein